MIVSCSSPGLVSIGLSNSLNALKNHTAFKLIGGGSLTEAPLLAQLAVIYASAGCTMVDLSADVGVVQTVQEALNAYLPPHQHPALMVSIPMDPDPHFAQLDLDEPACTVCGVCVPECPVEALTLEAHRLQVNNPRCYGCNRCVPVCPTQALQLTVQQPNVQAVWPALMHPAVSAVELHTDSADGALWPEFIALYDAALQGKCLSLCFRPHQTASVAWLSLVEQVLVYSQKSVPQYPLVLQLDGNPMTGSDDPNASRAAVEAAQLFFNEAQRHVWLQQSLNHGQIMVTLSGGINAHTPRLIQEAGLSPHIAGVGVGTVARKAVWAEVQAGLENSGGVCPNSVKKATALMEAFLTPCTNG
ncbi:MAG: 4Fe-4S binding protein [Vampirovibrionales bacterium]